MLCTDCPRKCSAIRNEETGEGYCHAPLVPYVSLAKLHFGEEPCISGTKGSGTVFFTGCSLKCVYCQNSSISGNDLTAGKRTTASDLKAIYRSLEEQGAHNINLVTPTHFVREISRSIDGSIDIPFCYNTSGYERPESLDMLKGKVQIYLTDYKYALSCPAKKYSHAPDYPDIILAALEKMYDLVGDAEFDDEGIMRKGIIIRHLILPGNTENSIKVIDAAERFIRGKKVVFSLMSQYVPHGNISMFKELQRPVSEEEYDTVTSYLYDSEIEDGYVQDMSSATDDFLPDFDMSGV